MPGKTVQTSTLQKHGYYQRVLEFVGFCKHLGMIRLEPVLYITRFKYPDISRPAAVKVSD